MSNSQSKLCIERQKGLQSQREERASVGALRVGRDRPLNKVPEAGMGVTHADESSPAWCPEADGKTS